MSLLMFFFVLNSAFAKLDYFWLNIQFAETPKTLKKCKFSINHLDIISQVINPLTHRSLPDKTPPEPDEHESSASFLLISPGFLVGFELRLDQPSNDTPWRMSLGNCAPLLVLISSQGSRRVLRGALQSTAEMFKVTQWWRMHNFSLWRRSDFLKRAVWQQQKKPFPVLSCPVIKRFPVSKATFEKLSLVGLQSISLVPSGCRVPPPLLGIFLACFPKDELEAPCPHTLCQPQNEADPLEKKKLIKSWESSGGQPEKKKKKKPGTGKFKFKEAKGKAEEIGPDKAGHNSSVCTGLLWGLPAHGR